MFRKRLTIALSLLAAASAMQVAAALWALGVADHHARHGRITQDIHLGFVELSATKQRLRTWVSQALLAAGPDTTERRRLQVELGAKIRELRRLSEQAIALGDDLGEEDRRAQLQRRETLDLLDRGVRRLAEATDAVQPLPQGADARQAWNALSEVFDLSDGQDLRALIEESIARASASVRRERAAADRTLRWMRRLWLGTAASLSVTALLLAWHFGRALRRPLSDLAEGAEALQRGELDHRIPEGRHDEFSVVAHSVNVLAAELKQHRGREAEMRLRLQDQVDARTGELQSALGSLQRADERRRQLFAEISHELRTPTTAIRGEAEVTLRGGARSASDYCAALQRIVETSRQLGLVIDDLLMMARSDIEALSLQRMPVDAAVPLREALSQIDPLAAEHGVRIVTPASWPKALIVLGDAQRLRQLMLVLLDNAVRYSHRGGTVAVTLRIDDANAGARQYCEIRIADQGIGIAPEDLPLICESSYRGAGARIHRADGSGLGLSIAQALVKAHAGSLTFESEPDRGTVVGVHLPLLSEPALLLDPPPLDNPLTDQP